MTLTQNLNKMEKAAADKRNIWAIGAIVLGITVYTLPLLLSLGMAFTLSQKNYVNCWYEVYFSALFYKASIFLFHQIPLWCFFFERGAAGIAHCGDFTFSPFSALILIFGAVKGLNLSFYILYVLGALSMYKLAGSIMKYNLFGALYCAFTFAMCGLFPFMQANGFIMARETLLLPLAVYLFFKAEYDNRYILFFALLLSLFFLETGLYYPVIALFFLSLTVLNSVRKEKGKITIKKRLVAVFLCGLVLSLVFSSFKLFPMLETMNAHYSARLMPYEKMVNQENTFALLFQRLFIAKGAGMGTMYLGYLPVFLCLTAGVLYFRKLRNWLFIMFLFIILSFGRNSFFDLNHLLWYLPIFNSIAEISKYYGLIIIFLISLTGGAFFSLYAEKVAVKTKNILFTVVIAAAYANLLIANSGYFNEYNTKLPETVSKNWSSHAKLINIHKGDEGGQAALFLTLFTKGIGLVNYCHIYNPAMTASSAGPKYFILPESAFLVPSTKLLIFANPAYKGEVFFLDKTNKVESFLYTPNAIRIKVNVSRPDILIINQNYSKWWKTDTGTVRNHDGNLSVILNNTGSYSVTVNFLPWSFYCGLVLSAVSLVVAAGCFLKKKHKGQNAG